jgi:hypothetical protein
MPFTGNVIVTKEYLDVKIKEKVLAIAPIPIVGRVIRAPWYRPGAPPPPEEYTKRIYDHINEAIRKYSFFKVTSKGRFCFIS